jgi:hypothetical protein
MTLMTLMTLMTRGRHGLADDLGACSAEATVVDVANRGRFD